MSSNPQSTPQERRQRLILLAACTLTALYVFCAAIQPIAHWFVEKHIAAASVAAAKMDYDTSLIFPNIEQHPTLASSFQWWTHPWVGAFSYWRPLTSQAFWVEYHLFKPTRFDLWAGVTLVSDLAAILSLSVFVYSLTGNIWAALLAAIIFVGPLNQMPLAYLWRWDAGEDVICSSVAAENWKDQPDLWASALVFGSMAATLKKRYGLAAFLAMIGPCFKELGWIALPLDFALIILKRELRSVPWRVVLICGLVSIAYLCLMMDASFFRLEHTGHGHNIHWLHRYLASVSGPFFGLFLARKPYIVLLATGLVTALTVTVPTWTRVAILIGTAVASAFLYAAVETADWMVGIVSFLLPESLEITGYAAAWLFGIWAVFSDANLRIPAAVLLVMRLITAANFVLTLAIGQHVLYLSAALNAGFLALAIIASLRRISSRFHESGGWKSLMPIVSSLTQPAA